MKQKNDTEVYTGREAFAFISYSHADVESVKAFLSKLSFAGIRYWYDKGIRSEQWMDRLVQQIMNCQVMIVFLSKDYMSSKHCNTELALAYDNNKKLFVIRLDHEPLSGKSAYILSGLNYADSFVQSIDEIMEMIRAEDWVEACRSIYYDDKVLEHQFTMDIKELYYDGGISAEEGNGNESIWGPEREMFKSDGRPNRATLNSEESALFGDERFFVGVREKGNGEYLQELAIQSGKIYEVRILYHNNATDKSNKEGYGVATNLRAAVRLPVAVFPGEEKLLTAALQASIIDNRSGEDIFNNIKVWSSVHLHCQNSITLIQFRYASARIENKGSTNGQILPTSLFSEKGTPLGFNKLAGTLPGGDEYAGYIHFEFRTL